MQKVISLEDRVLSPDYLILSYIHMLVSFGYDALCFAETPLKFKKVCEVDFYDHISLKVLLGHEAQIMIINCTDVLGLLSAVFSDYLFTLVLSGASQVVSSSCSREETTNQSPVPV